MDRPSDETLARRASGGDDEAFGALYERYHRPLELYCRSIVRHHEDARDAAQSAMAKALVALRRRCLATDGICRGRVSASLRLGASARALAKRGYLTSAGRRAVTLRITGPRALRRRARAAARRTLVLRVRSLRPAAPLRSVALALGRPR
jgi:hypothetical protein